MKVLRQFLIIMIISLLGEILNRILPFPVPASVYGLVLMLTALMTGLIRVPQVKEASVILIELMPVMFIPAAVGLLETWDVIAPVWLEYVAVTVLSTWIVMIISGKVTQSVIRHRKKGVQENHV